MKRILITAFITLLSCIAFAQGGSPDDRAVALAEELQPVLGLNSTQFLKIKGLAIVRNRKIDELRKNAATNPNVAQDIKAVNDQFDNELKAFLEPEQVASYDNWKAQKSAGKTPPPVPNAPAGKTTPATATPTSTAAVSNLPLEDELKNALKLTPKQYLDVKTANAAKMKQIADAKKSTPPAQLGAAIKGINEKFETDLLALLTDEQKTEYEKWKENRAKGVAAPAGKTEPTATTPAGKGVASTAPAPAPAPANLPLEDELKNALKLTPQQYMSVKTANAAKTKQIADARQSTPPAQLGAAIKSINEKFEADLMAIFTEEQKPLYAKYKEDKAKGISPTTAAASNTVSLPFEDEYKEPLKLTPKQYMDIKTLGAAKAKQIAEARQKIPPAQLGAAIKEINDKYMAGVMNVLDDTQKSDLEKYKEEKKKAEEEAAKKAAEEAQKEKAKTSAPAAKTKTPAKK
jgi:hypothetical protein